jgi:hypothetical protein
MGLNPGGHPSWDLLFILGNLHLVGVTPFDGQVLRVCAGNDPILHQLHPSAGNATGRQMIGQFRTQFGVAYLPACLVVRRGAPARVRHAPSLRSFRNCCAIATILPAYRGGQLQPNFSDHFDIYPLVAGHSGMVVTNDAITMGMHAPHGFAGQPSPTIGGPQNFATRPSLRLFGRLMYAWRTCYIGRRRRRDLLRLFRSLEIALHAMRFPTDSLMSVHDAGLRLLLWVSAIEILLHVRRQRKWEC